MTNGRIAVLCPTRDRVPQFAALVSSVVGTSDVADVLCYIDEDQQKDYRGVSTMGTFRGRCIPTIGPRIGPVASVNELADSYPDYDLYGMITDDSEIITVGWDQWALEAISLFPNKVCVISPHHNLGNHVDMPFVTSNWIKATGWFAWPEAYHYTWPTVTGLIGEMTAIVHAPRHKWHIEHDYDDAPYQDRRALDNGKFYNYVSLAMQTDVERVREAMAK